MVQPTATPMVGMNYGEKYFCMEQDDMGYVEVKVLDEPDGNVLGTPIRFKYTSNGMIAADMPAVNASYFASDPVTHVIVNG